MSKLTSQEIIDKGEYLHPAFDPSSLLVAHLRAILQAHEIHFPANANKSQLIKLFESDIRPNAQEYERQRRITAAIPSDASDILDGETGEYLQPPDTKKSSRKSTRGSVAKVSDPSPTRTVVRQKRSTLVPKEDLTDDEEELLRKHKEQYTPVDPDRKARRISQKWGTKDENSNWEDNNPFQLGTVDTPPRKAIVIPSSPADPTPSKGTGSVQRRLSRGAASGRKSRQLDPRDVTPEHRYLVKQEAVSPLIGRMGIDGIMDNNDIDDYDGGDSTANENSPERDAYTAHNSIISHKIATLNEKRPKEVSVVKRSNRLASRPLAFGTGLFSFLFFISLLWTWRAESMAIGYCDTSTTSNSVLESSMRDLKQVAECQERRSLLPNKQDRDAIICDSSSSWGELRPLRCTPCPEHAICHNGNIECETAYTFYYGPLSYLTFLNGLPQFGPIAFPPKCIPDERRRRSVSAMGKNIEMELAQLRGQRICQGDLPKGNGPNWEASTYGLSREDLVSKIERIRGRNRNHGQFMDIFTQAIQELKEKGLLVYGKDSSNTEWITTIRDSMDLGCQAKVFLRERWQTHKIRVLGVALAGLLILAGRSSLARRTIEDVRVKGLVHQVRERLKDQEYDHHANNVLSPSPSLSSLQLRDSIMADEHSMAARARIWRRVEKIVESDSNVRANVDVMPSGDEGRVWTWVGASEKRRITFNQPDTGRPVA